MTGRFQETMKECSVRFRSARMTAGIMAVLLALFFVSLLIPQKSLFPTRDAYLAWKEAAPVLSRVIEALGLNEITTSPLTVLFLVLFFLNLLVVTVHRVPVLARKAFLSAGDIPALDAAAVLKQPGAVMIEGAGVPAAAVRSFFLKRHWTVLDAPGGFFAVRNRYSPFGFLLFHLSFLLCLIGALVVMYTRFSGYLVLTEGQEFYADMTQFKRITRDPAILKELPDFGITLQRVRPEYRQGISTDLTVEMLLRKGSAVEPVVVRTNEPVKRGSLTILAEGIGVSPLFVLRSAGGDDLDGGYVSLNILDGREDTFEFTGRPERFAVKFYPDHVVRDGQDATASKELRNPLLVVLAVRDEKVFAEGRLRPGGQMRIGTQFLVFEDLRYWVNFLVVREYGTTPLFIGFVIGAAGLIMRLVFFQRTIRAAWPREGGRAGIAIAGQSEYYTYGFAEEFRGLARQLADELGGEVVAAPGTGGGKGEHGVL